MAGGYLGQVEDFRELADAAVDALLAAQPEEATALGDHRFDHQLAERDLGLQEALAGRLADWGRRVANLERPGLDQQAQVDLEILGAELERAAFSLRELREPAWNPLVYNPGDALYPLLTRDTQPIGDRLRAIRSRLELVPGLVALGMRQLENPPAIHVKTALEQHGGAAQLMTDEVSRLAAGWDDVPGRSGLAAAQVRAADAWQRFGVFLDDLQQRAAGEYRLGPEGFSKKLRLTLQSDLSPAQISERAQTELFQVRGELDRRACALLGEREGAEGAAERALDRIAAERPDNATVIAECERILAAAARTVRASGLIQLPDDSYEIEVMPEFRRGVAGAYCDPAGPFEEGAKTKIAIAPAPSDWTPQRVESFYREYNLTALAELMAHEGVPGHMLQLAWARRFAGPSKVRQALWSGPFVEGWACHAERIMAELGFGGEAFRLVQLKVRLRFTLNAIIDAGVHAEAMDEGEALQLMTRVGLQEQEEAAAKWRRACLTSCQLSTYFVGYAELDDLFREAGEISSYDPYLAQGSPPPRLLRRLVPERQ